MRKSRQWAWSLRSLLVFVPTAVLLLGAPIRWFDDSSVSAAAMAGGLLAWVAAAVGIIFLGRTAVERDGDLAAMFSRYLLFVFAIFFAVERIGGLLVAWPHLDTVQPALAWTQGVGSLIAAIGAVLLLPRLGNVREGAAQARQDHAHFLAAAENSLDDFYIFDGVPDASGEVVDFRFSYINPNAERRLHVTKDELLGKILTEVRPFMVRSGLIEKYREVVRTGASFTCEVFLDDERIRATWLNVQVVKLGSGIAITSRDITEHKRLTEHVNYLAHHDQLTALPNRTLLMDRLQQAILNARRHGGKFAVFLIDIDSFKRINDTLGHLDGDGVLAAVAARLRASVRACDTVARMGGDEFVVVMSAFTGSDDVRICGQKILDEIARPLRLGHREIVITVSIGAAIFPEHGASPDSLLRAADQAMYGIKDSGRNGLRVASAAEDPTSGAPPSGASVHLPRPADPPPVSLPVFAAHPGSSDPAPGL